MGIHQKYLLGAAAILIALFAGMQLTGKQTTPDEKVMVASAREVLRIGVTQYPSTLHPMFDPMVAKTLVLGASLRAMTAYDADWQPVCLLCTELPSYENGRAKKVTLKNGKKGITATYTLKDGLMWSDGKALTASDFVFAYDVGKHPQSGVGNGSFYSEDIDNVKAVDAKTLEITFTKEICEFAAISDFYPLPAHLEQDIFKSDPATYLNRTLYVTAPTTPGLWMGPYVVSAAESGASLTLDKNQHWHGKPAAFNQIVFRTVENSAALSANLLAGDIDYIAGELGLTLDQALSFEKRLPAGKYTVSYIPSLTYEHIDLPLDRAPFDDLRVRQALLLSTNRDGINDTLFAGQQQPAVSNINPRDTIFTDQVTLYPYDLARAEALLDEAGWKKGEDGLRRNEKNEVLRVTLSTTAGNKTRETIQQAIQADWAKAGIETIIQNQPARVLFGDTMRLRQFQGGVMYAWMSSPRNIPKTTLHSTMIPSEQNN